MERSNASAQISAPVGAACLLARAAGRLCALPLANVIEVLRPLPIEALPTMPPSVLGLSTIRGTPLPVVDLAQFFEARAANGHAPNGAQVTRPTSSGERFITFRTDDMSRVFALRVEAIERIGQLSGVEWETLPPLLKGAHSETIEAIGTLDSRVLLLLKTARLIDDETWGLIEKERRA